MDGKFRAEYVGLVTVRSNPCLNGLKVSLMKLGKYLKYPQRRRNIYLYTKLKVEDFELLAVSFNLDLRGWVSVSEKLP